MKKITLLAFACAMFMGIAVANAQEVTYVEDPAQGYLLNSFKDNWFIQGEGGVGMMMSKWDRHAKFGDRIGAKANLFVGKWFSPIFGARIGAEYNHMVGATENPAAPGAYLHGNQKHKWAKDTPGWYKQSMNFFGISGDAMLNLTNLFCGYKPGRVYNATLYAGASVQWGYYRASSKNGVGDLKWKYAGGHSQFRMLSVRAGLLNSFAVTKRLDILLDLRFDMSEKYLDGAGNKSWIEYPGILAGLSYKLGKTDWNAPMVNVCPKYKYTNEEGDALISRLNAANRKIADLEAQLKACLDGQGKRGGNDPVVVNQSADAPLATIYYPINRTEIVGVQKNVVEAVAEVMAAESNNYVLTGWADNYTGNDEINTRLRKGRVAGVKDALVKKGISAARLDTQINDGNLTNYGPKCASLDRAVTINRVK